MSADACNECGREPENGTATHWLGCEGRPGAVRGPAMDATVDLAEHMDSLCEFGECTNPKRPQTKGPKPKYCDEHSDPKNRK